MINTYGQVTLFGKKIISTIGYNEQEIIRDILYLHGKGNTIELDPTFSTGHFYKKGLPLPKHRYDKFPQTAGTSMASSDDLPLKDSSINVIMFDPPFIIGGQKYMENKKGSSVIAKRFTSFKNFKELEKMYFNSLKEFNRLLVKNGILIFKCQDVVAGGKQYFTHCFVFDWAKKYGFYPLDLFILLSKNRIIDGRKQQHARKFHSYFWVLQKT